MATNKRPGLSMGLALGAMSIAWSAIVTIAAVPWYVDLLGIESYGIIGFYATLQAAISLLDLGLGATISREVARSTALYQLDHARRLLRSLEALYAALMIAIGAALWFAAPAISRSWLKPGELPVETVQSAMHLIAVVVALRWPTGLYLGTLIGLQRQAVSYRITAAVTTLANGGAIALLVYYSPSLEVYFVWQALVALCFVGWARTAAWRNLGRGSKPGVDRHVLARVALQSIAMSGVSMTGLLLTQLDKVVVSSSVSLESFGHYALAGVFATGLSILVIPTYNAIYPRLAVIVASGTAEQLERFYRTGTRLFIGAITSVAVSGYAYSETVLTVWTGDAVLAAQVAPIAGLLVLGSALNAVMLFPYALQLAKGAMTLALTINIVLIAIMFPSALLLVRAHGALGGALTWLLLNAVFVVIGGFIAHAYTFPSLRWSWMLRDVLPGLAFCGFLVLVSSLLVKATPVPSIVQLLLAGGVSLGAAASAACFDRGTRKFVIASASAWKRRRRDSAPDETRTT